jgi:hypothetical protein
MTIRAERIAQAEAAVDRHIADRGFVCLGIEGAATPHGAFDLRATWQPDTRTHHIAYTGCTSLITGERVRVHDDDDDDDTRHHWDTTAPGHP